MLDEDHEFQEFKKELVERSGEDIGFFSHKNKKEVERIAVAAFLRIMDLNFRSQEIIPNFNEENDKADVYFRNARFQVRELLDKNRKRHDEFRERHEKYSKSKSMKDCVFPYTTPTPISLQNVIYELTSALEEKARRYGSELCKELDALVVVSLKGNFLDTRSTAQNIELLKSQDWRSVSILQRNSALVIFASPSAPKFISDLEGNLRIKSDIVKDSNLYELAPYSR